MSDSTLLDGVVTFLLTDVEDSTGHWSRDPEHAPEVMRHLRETIAEAVADHGGQQPLEQGEGDSSVSAFLLPSNALAAAIEIQRTAAGIRCGGEPVRLRIGIHTGEATLVDDRTYGGTSIVRCARLRDLGTGGQVLMSSVSAAVAADALPDGASVRLVGTVQLKGLDRAELVHQLVHPDLSGGVASLDPVSSKSRLPSFPTSLIGRTDEIAKVSALLADRRLVAISGAGGSGKTRLAHAVAAHLEDRYEDGAFWVELAPVTDAAGVASAIATGCGLSEAVGTDPAVLVTRLMQAKDVLLVLDNCEHLLEAVAQLCSDVLRVDSQSRVLVTSRETLGISGEATWRISSLSLPPDDDGDLASAEAAEAVQLFIERAGDGGAQLQLDEETIVDVVHICRRLDGIPLAIELAAARLRTMSLSQLAEGLDDRFRLLTTGTRVALERHRTLLASVEWSHDLLDADERTLFRRLSVFVAPFTVERAEAVVPDDDLDRLGVFDLLARLVDKSLVVHDGRGRYSMLETIRQYAEHRAADAGELPDLRDRHLRYFALLAEGWQLERELGTFALLEEIGTVVADLRRALAWVPPTDVDTTAALARGVQFWLAANTRFAETASLARDLCAHHDEGSTAWLRILSAFLPALTASGDWWWFEPLDGALSRDSDDLAGLPPASSANLRAAHGLVGYWLGDATGSHQMEAAIEQARAAHCRAVETWASCYLVLNLLSDGDVRRARPIVDWLERNTGDVPVVGPMVANDRCLLDYGLCQPRRDTVLERARKMLEPPITHPTAYTGVNLLAALYRDLDLFGLVLERMADNELSVSDYERLVPVLVQGERALAAGELEEAFELCRLAGDTWPMRTLAATQRAKAGLAALALGRVDAAAEQAGLARADGRLAPHPDALVRLVEAGIARSEGRWNDAADAAHDALRSGHDSGGVLLVLLALEAVAVLDAEAGRSDDAARLLGATEAFRARTGVLLRYPGNEATVPGAIAAADPDRLAEGAQLSLDEAVDYALRLRGKRGRPEFGWDSLTDAEQRVVDLVAEGMSNKAIAEKLFVSVATVKSHLVHVYRKLELGSRNELIARAATHERS